MRLFRYNVSILAILVLFISACDNHEAQSEGADNSKEAATSSASPEASDNVVSEQTASSEIDIPYMIEDSSQVQTLEGGIQLYIIEKGNGTIPQPGRNVVINYHGTLLDGSVFDSSFDKPGMMDFNLNQLIRGWQIGLTAVPSGSKIKLVVPPEMGYGSQERDNIPANSTLVFDIDLASWY